MPEIVSTITCCFTVSVDTATAKAMISDACLYQAGTLRSPRMPAQHSQLTAQCSEGNRLLGSSMEYSKRTALSHMPPPVTSGRSIAAGSTTNDSRHMPFIKKSAR